MRDLQDLHLAPGAIERVLGWWRDFGGRRAAMLALAVTLPLIRYEYIPHVLSTSIETLAEGYGMHLTVGEWETSLSDIKIVGRDVEITTGGPYREKRLFRANRVEFDWSLARALSNGLARVAGCWTVVVGRPCTLPEEVFHRITVDGATLHLERTLAGAWNAEDAVHVESLEALSRALARWRFPTIDGEDLSISWVEHLPGDSDGGLVEQRTSSLDFTKVTLAVSNLQLPVDERANGARVTFDGQTADGQVSIVGAMNPSRWQDGGWAPSYDLTFRLVNVGAATFGRFAAPDATLVPRAGRVDGEILMARTGETLDRCRINLRLRDVQYAPNPRSPFTPAGGPAFESQVRDVRITDVVARDCIVDDERPGTRVSQTLQTLVTSSALEQAPPLVRSAAGYDQSAVIDGHVPTPAELRTQITQQIGLGLGEALAGEKGAAVVKALTTSTPSATSGGAQGGNPLTRGARSVGRGIRRLFGGGKTAAPAKKR
ncbi:MAG: hypothetical protein R2708_23320 [Vicinamibacterales bacterium]